jgi:lipoprotein NlpI
MLSWITFLVAIVCLCALPVVIHADAGDDLAKVRKALAAGKVAQAVELADKAAAAHPKEVAAHLLCGEAHAAAGNHDKAVAAYSRALELDPEQTEAYHQLGCANFKAGKIAASLAAFDKYLRMAPDRRKSHWQRGITCYYAGSYADGQKQFEGYQDYDSNDVENGVWRYLCMARVTGREKARAAMLKIGEDKRVPMKEIYAMFKGELKPADVLAKAKAGKATPAQLNERLFYAHLYIGLYHDAEGNKQEALAHLAIAADEHRIGHYMWDVARVHRDLLRKKEASQ